MGGGGAVGDEPVVMKGSCRGFCWGLFGLGGGAGDEGGYGVGRCAGKGIVRGGKVETEGGIAVDGEFRGFRRLAEVGDEGLVLARGERDLFCWGRGAEGVC